MTDSDATPDADTTPTNGRRAESTGERTDAFVWDTSEDTERGTVEDAWQGDAEDSHADHHAVGPERYLLGGESLVDSFETGAGWVAITTHRLLVFDPESDGRRFEAIDRLNVAGVRATGGGDPERLSTVVRAGIYAAVLLLTWGVARSFGLGSVFTATADTAGTPGIGGLVSALSLVGALFSLLVSLLFLAGAVVGAVAVGLGLLYLRGRHPTLVIERAGDERIAVSVSSSFAGERVVSAVERALAAELALADDEG